MTVTYTAQVATCKHLGCFWKLLFRWRGSIYKLLWINMLCYMAVYVTIAVVYKFCMTSNQQSVFQKVCERCRASAELIPITFILGFYVTTVVARWWDQYLSIPWPDSLALSVSALVTGQDMLGRVMRRTIMRYANLSLVITFTMICPYVKKRFPTLQHLVDAGLLLQREHERFKELDARTRHPKHWLPLLWACAIIARARREGRVQDDVSFKTLIEEVNKFRTGCGSLLNYDWIAIPLVYPQVVSWVVYSYCFASILGYQFLIIEDANLESKIVKLLPIFPMLQFFFYMGWLLVAETLANPFGEDDDDFDVSWLIDRNLQVSYMIVDEMFENVPTLLKDKYWDDSVPPDLPYLPGSSKPHNQTFVGSTRNLKLKPSQHDAAPTTAPSKWKVLKGKYFDNMFLEAITENIIQSCFIDVGSSEICSERILKVFHHQSLSASKLTFGSSFSVGNKRGSRSSGSQGNSFISANKEEIADSGSPTAVMKIFPRKNTFDLGLDEIFFHQEEGKKGDSSADNETHFGKVHFMDDTVSISPTSTFTKTDEADTFQSEEKVNSRSRMTLSHSNEVQDFFSDQIGLSKKEIQSSKTQQNYIPMGIEVQPAITGETDGFIVPLDQQVLLEDDHASVCSDNGQKNELGESVFETETKIGDTKPTEVIIDIPELIDQTPTAEQDPKHIEESNKSNESSSKMSSTDYLAIPGTSKQEFFYSSPAYTNISSADPAIKDVFSSQEINEQPENISINESQESESDIKEKDQSDDDFMERETEVQETKSYYRFETVESQDSQHKVNGDSEEDIRTPLAAANTMTNLPKSEYPTEKSPGNLENVNQKEEINEFIESVKNAPFVKMSTPSTAKSSISIIQNLKFSQEHNTLDTIAEENEEESDNDN